MRSRIHSEKGFTMVEILIAMTILAVGILGIGGLASTAIRSSGFSQSMTQANNLAQDRIEALMSVDFDNLQVTDSVTARTDLRRVCVQTDTTVTRPVWSCTPSSPTITLDNKGFSWSYTVTSINLDGGAAADNGDGLKRLDVQMSWSDPLWHSTRSISVVTLRHKG